ncbi:MAG TPA: outer membrane beta-barrel family protein [Flavisolibacter sp.]
MKPLLVFFALSFSLTTFPQAKDSIPAADTIPGKSLKAVTITATKRPIDVQPDKIVLNLDAQPAAIGENALDVLRRSPGVVVDAAENIQMNGKAGINILLDGKSTQLSAQDLAQLLKSIEAANIQQIELIANPSAKYDAAGNAGIINIKLKKSLTNGFNGNLTGSYVQSRHARQNTTTNLNWRKNRTAFFFNGGINHGLQHVTANNYRTAGPYTFTQQSLEKDAFHGYSVRAGADYSLNKKSTLGMLWMLNKRATTMNNSSVTTIRLPSSADTNISTVSVAPFSTGRNSVNLNYNYTSQSVEYVMDADYTSFQSSVDNLIKNDVRNSAGAKLGSDAVLNDQQVNIKLYSMKADLVKTFTSGLKLEAGVKLMATRTSNRLAVQNNSGAEWLLDTGKTNLFRYKEDVGALYASLRGNSNDFSWQLGLRSEQTNVNGRSTDLKKNETNSPDTSYLNLFPTIFLQYKLSAKHQLGLSANRRIDRPNYQDQNPFIYFLDALNSEQGNAYLKPQFTNSVEVSYTYNYATSVKVSYAKTTSYIEWLTYQDGKYTVQTPQNAGTKEMLGFSFSSPVTISKRWSAYVSLTPYYHFYRVQLSGFGNSEEQSGGSWAFNSYVGNNIELGKGWKGSLGGWFNFQNRATIYVSKPLGSLDIGVQKNILKEKATLKVSLVDLFNTQRWQQTAITNELRMTTYRKWESQNITLGFSWRFGNSKIKKAREREADEEGVKRIK